MVKALSLTEELPLILLDLSVDDGGGMQHVAVKCVDMLQNTNCEGIFRNHY